MEIADKEIVCRECGSAFVWTAGEQQFFQEKGLTNIPSRCPICRKKRNVRHDFAQTYDIICSICGKKAKSPFKPDNPDDLVCQECFLKKQEESQKNQQDTGSSDDVIDEN